jgi:hypothetical protein
VIEDDVVKEGRAAREAFAAAHGYDIRAMAAALRELTIANGWKVVRLPPRPVVTPPAPVTSAPDTAAAGELRR